MANPIKLRYRQFLLACQWLLHWCTFLTIPTLSLLILAPVVVVISVRALLIAKAKHPSSCPHCGNSLNLPLKLQEVIFPDCEESSECNPRLIL